MTAPRPPAATTATRMGGDAASGQSGSVARPTSPRDRAFFDGGGSCQGHGRHTRPFQCAPQPHHHMKNDNPAAGSAAAIAPRTGRDAQAAWLRGHLRRAGERGPTRMGREPPKPRLLTLITSPPCRAQRSLRGQPSCLRMGFVEWTPQSDPRGCKPPCSMRGHPPFRPGWDVFRRSGSCMVWSSG